MADLDKPSRAELPALALPALRFGRSRAVEGILNLLRDRSSRQAVLMAGYLAIDKLLGLAMRGRIAREICQEKGPCYSSENPASVRLIGIQCTALLNSGLLSRKAERSFMRNRILI